MTSPEPELAESELAESELAPSAIDASVGHDVPTATSTGEASVTAAYDALLLASFGGPEGQDDVLPFLRNVTRGRGIPDERLEAVAGHYRALGGISPINAQNEALRSALETELAARGIDLPVLWGNRNWQPYTTDVLRDAHAGGIRTVLGLATSAYSSYSSCRQYREDFGIALDELGLDDLRVDKMRHYFNLAGFLAPVLDGVVAGVRQLLEGGRTAEELVVMYSTHSIPDTMSDASGPADTRRPGSGGWYVAQHQAAIAWVHERAQAELGVSLTSEFVFQSRSGNPRQPWLEPDINDAIEQASAVGRRGVVCVPIGFVSDHVEVVWDLDTEAAETAAGLGLDFVRTPTAGTDPRFVAALVDLVEERLGRRGAVETVTTFGATPDVCGVACCVGAKLRPTVAGADSAADRAAAAQTGAAQ